MGACQEYSDGDSEDIPEEEVRELLVSIEPSPTSAPNPIFHPSPPPTAIFPSSNTVHWPQPLMDMPLATKVVTPPTPVSRAPIATVRGTDTDPVVPKGNRSGDRRNCNGKQTKQRDEGTVEGQQRVGNDAIVDVPDGVTTDNLAYVRDARGLVSIF